MSFIGLMNIENDVVVTLSPLSAQLLVDWNRSFAVQIVEISIWFYHTSLTYLAWGQRHILFLSFLLIKWNSYLAMITLSIICLPATKALWFIEINLCRISFILLARILEITLYKTLQNAIGLKSDGYLFWIFFKISTRLVWFNWLGKCLLLKKF